MKKIFFILMMLFTCLTPVYADNTVTESYTVTIPSSVTVNDTANFNVSISNAVLNSGKQLIVSANSSNYSSDWRMKNGSVYQRYYLEKGSTDIAPGDAIISLPAGSASASATLTVTMRGIPSASGTYTDNLIFTFSSVVKPNAKYAVSLYGIGQDVDQNGNTMGLTFGPALDNTSYINNYKSHYPYGSTSSGHARRCIHDDDWETIVYWNNVDPEVYQQCISKGCTHSVELVLNETLYNPSFTEYESSTGDGPSMLHHELKTNNTNFQHLEWNPLQATGSTTYGNTVGGWGASRIRAMLNGKDSLTQTGTTYATYATTNYIPTMAATAYNSTNCLLSCFPSVLQDAIGSRKTIYHGTYNANTQSICYDKLFLLSQQEISTSTNSKRANEGTTYTKFASGSHAYDSSDRTRIGYGSGSGEWWLRSPGYYFAYGVCYVGGNGTIGYIDAYGDTGVAPAFALKRS